MNRKWIGLGLLVIGGYVTYKVVRALGLMLGLWHPAQVAQARPSFSPMLFSAEFALAQDTGASWHDPAAASKSREKILGRPKELQRQALAASNGDPGPAMDKLFEQAKSLDGAQALFDAMRELAPQGPAASSADNTQAGAQPTKQQPLFMAQREPGIVHVARVAQRLMARSGKPDMGAFDTILQEDAIRLMGFHGAPDVQGGKKAMVAGQSQSVSPIDPVVKGVLRLFLNSSEPYTQALACRALGQLGDAETAEDLIKHPGKYPGASIADFGPASVEKWKQHRMALLKSGRGGGDAAFWQGVRLTPQYQDVAIDLARAGDAGASLAVERNMALEAAYAKDPDGRMAGYLNVALRFPGTREAWIAGNACGNLGWFLGNGYNPKTQEAFLRCLDHDLKIVFSQDSHWRLGDLTVLNGQQQLLTCLYHLRVSLPGTWNGSKLGPFYAQIEVLFRKYYRKIIAYATYAEAEKDYSRMGGMSMELSLFARHLGLGAIEHPQRKEYLKYIPQLVVQEPATDESKDGQWWTSRRCANCLRDGHIKSLEDF